MNTSHLNKLDEAHGSIVEHCVNFEIIPAQVWHKPLVEFHSLCKSCFDDFKSQRHLANASEIKTVYLNEVDEIYQISRDELAASELIPTQKVVDFLVDKIENNTDLTATELHQIVYHLIAELQSRIIDDRLYDYTQLHFKPLLILNQPQTAWLMFFVGDVLGPKNSIPQQYSTGIDQSGKSLANHLANVHIEYRKRNFVEFKADWVVNNFPAIIDVLKSRGHSIAAAEKLLDEARENSNEK